MSKRQWLIILGVLIIALPFLGFPSNWDTIISVIVGLLIIVISYRINLSKVVKEEKSSTIPYVEQKNEGVNINNDSKSPMNL